jgi:crotonobetainyl-CoA:carnitine CoA-transferase CaiB-like acyl-CoA transferase
MMNITGPLEGPPYKVGVALADILTGQYASTAILACLHARARSGHGYAIDVSLLDCALAAQVNVAQAYLATGKVSPRQGNAHLQIVPYRLYATADGWLVLNVGNDSQWQSFCKATGEAELANDPRFTTNRLRVTNRSEIEPIVETIMMKQSTTEWEIILNDANVTHAAVWDYARLFASEHIAARGMRVTVRDPHGQPVDLIGNPIHLHGAPLTAASLAPTLGQHTHEVLKTLANLTDEQLAELKNDKTI